MPRLSALSAAGPLHQSRILIAPYPSTGQSQTSAPKNTENPHGNGMIRISGRYGETIFAASNDFATHAKMEPRNAGWRF